MGHWYDEKSKPRHFEAKNGGDTTLREARRLSKEGDPLHPSVTTILDMLDKPGLTYWLQKEAAIKAGFFQLDSNLATKNPDDNWAKGVISAAKESVAEKADIGTNIHDTLEKYHDSPFEVTGNDRKLCEAIVDCIEENTGLNLFDDFIPEKIFCDTEHGFAGMCDLHTKPISKSTHGNNLPDMWVIDYKTKDNVTSKTRGFDNQAEQLAAYSHGLKIPNARLANIFIDRNPPEEGKPWSLKFFEHKNAHLAWQNFLHTLRAWQVRKKYGTYFEELEKENDG